MGKKPKKWININFSNYKDIDWKDKFLHHERYGPPGNFWGTDSGLHRDGLIEKKKGKWRFKKGVSAKEKWAAFGKHSGHGNAKDGYIRFNIDDIDEDNYKEVNWHRQYENMGFERNFLNDPTRPWMGGQDKEKKWENFIDKLDKSGGKGGENIGWGPETDIINFGSWGAKTDFESPELDVTDIEVTPTDKQTKIRENIQKLGEGGIDPITPPPGSRDPNIPSKPIRPPDDTLDVAPAPAEVDRTGDVQDEAATAQTTADTVKPALTKPLTDTELGTGGTDTLQGIDDTYQKYQPTAIKDLDTTIDDIKAKSDLFQTNVPEPPEITPINEQEQGLRDQFAQFEQPRTQDRKQILSAMGSKLRQSSSARAGRTTLGTGAFKHRITV